MNQSPDIPAFLDRRPLVWNYTMLHTYKEICPHQAAERFIYKTIPFVETEAMKFGKDVHSAMEYRIGGKPLPEQFRHWEDFVAPLAARGVKAEMKLAVTAQGHATGYFDKDVWGRGKVDATISSETAAYLGDFKTGGSKYEDPFELRVHAMLLNAKFPALKIIKAQYIWLKEERWGEVYDVSDTLSTWNEVSAIVAAIEADKKHRAFAKRRGPLCAYCPVADCEHNNNPELKK